MAPRKAREGVSYRSIGGHLRTVAVGTLVAACDQNQFKSDTTATATITANQGAAAGTYNMSPAFAAKISAPQPVVMDISCGK